MRAENTFRQPDQFISFLFTTKVIAEVTIGKLNHEVTMLSMVAGRKCFCVMKR